MNATDFHKGDRVIYVPGIAHGDPKHEACEHGQVSSVNEKYVFVRLDKTVAKLGWEGTTSQSCRPEDLQLQDSV